MSLFAGALKTLRQIWALPQREHHGRRLKRIGRDEFEYIRGDHALRIQTELLCGIPNTLIYAGTIQHLLPPHTHEPISPEERRLIAMEVKEMLNKRGLSSEIDWGD